MDSTLPSRWGDALLEDSVSPLQESHSDPLREISPAAAASEEVDPNDEEAEEEFIYPTEGARMYP